MAGQADAAGCMDKAGNLRFEKEQQPGGGFGKPFDRLRIKLIMCGWAT
jgi:hypothetical protein